MPGRNAQQAFDEFIKHFQAAIAVLDAPANFLVAKKGGFRKDVSYAWSVNGPRGLELGKFGQLHAEMNFQIIDADAEKYEQPLRVTTTGYRYKLSRDGTDRWRIHWHPTGNSPVKEPHLHLPPNYEHLPTGRITFEKAIVWCIEQGAPLRFSREEALNRVAEAEAPHMLFRSWSDRPLPGGN